MTCIFFGSEWIEADVSSPCSVPCLSVTEKDSEEARVIGGRSLGPWMTMESKAACHTGTSALNFGIYEKKKITLFQTSGLENSFVIGLG